MIIKCLAVGPYGTNCYIAGEGAKGEGIVIDPGAESKVILETIRSSELSVKQIVITHGHADHVGAAEEVKKAIGGTIAMHTDDVRMARSYIKSADRLLKDGDKITAGKLEFIVLQTPGHSPGGISLYGKGVLFCGDTLFNYGIGRTDFFGGDITQLINSIRGKLLVLPDETVVYPGHGPKTTIGEERRGNPFLRRES